MFKLLTIIERIAVTVAALLAVFPLWQFFNETEARQFDRDATLILAYDSCNDAGVMGLLKLIEENSDVKRIFVDYPERVSTFIRGQAGQDFYLDHFDEIGEYAHLLDWYADDGLIVKCATILRQSHIPKDI